MNGPITKSQSTTSPLNNKTRKIVKVPPRKAVAFFIGGAADKKKYYGQGPNYNIRDAMRSTAKRLSVEAKIGAYLDIYLGYDDVKGRADLKENVTNNIPSKSSAVYIVGHSLGGWNGAHLSKQLSDDGYDVAMLITLDPVGHGFLVWLGSDIYRKTPTPKAKFWINVRADVQEKKRDSSDKVADFGEQWDISSGPDINTTVNVHHYDAVGIFTSHISDEKSPEDYMYNSIKKFFNEN